MAMNRLDSPVELNACSCGDTSACILWKSGFDYLGIFRTAATGGSSSGQSSFDGFEGYVEFDNWRVNGLLEACMETRDESTSFSSKKKYNDAWNDLEISCNIHILVIPEWLRSLQWTRNVLFSIHNSAIAVFDWFLIRHSMRPNGSKSRLVRISNEKPIIKSNWSGRHVYRVKLISTKTSPPPPDGKPECTFQIHCKLEIFGRAPVLHTVCARQSNASQKSIRTFPI